MSNNTKLSAFNSRRRKKLLKEIDHLFYGYSLLISRVFPKGLHDNQLYKNILYIAAMNNIPNMLASLKSEIRKYRRPSNTIASMSSVISDIY